MKNTKNPGLARRLVALAVLSCGSSVVQAQSETATETMSILELEEVIVTAQRVESLITQTPVAISNVNGEQLLAAGVSDPTNLGALVPNLSIDRQAAGGLQITIRGVSSDDNTEKGDPSAAFLLDGIYIARNQAQEVSFFDLERVEVLRGPQGTLYGRNTTAGVINVLSKRPSDEFGGSLDVAFGDFGNTQATGVLNVPLTETTSIRAAVNLDQRENYTIQASDAGFTLDDFKDNISGRLSASFKPNENLSIVLIADRSDLEGVSQSSLPLDNFYTGTFAPGAEISQIDLDSDARRTSNFPQTGQSFRDNSTTGFTVQVDWNVGGGTLTYLGATRDLDRSEQESVVLGLVRQNFEADYTQDSHELRYAFDVGDGLDGQVGLYYFDEESDIEARFNDQLGVLGIPPGSTLAFLQDPTTAESRAAFAQFGWKISDSVKLTGGVRHSEDDKSRVGTTELELPIGVSIPTNVNDAEREFDETTWHFGVDYDLGNGLLYASASTGYKAGGFNDGCVIGTQQGCNQPEDVLFYEPETLTSLEAGWKLSLSERLRFNGSIFNYDYEDLQLSQIIVVSGAPATNITNAAEASVIGLELDAQYLINDRNRLDLGLTLLDAEFDDFTPIPGVNFDGAQLSRAPESTFSASYTHIYPFASGANLLFNIKTKLSSSYFVNDVSAALRFEQPSFSKTDIAVTYNSAGERWYLQGYASNLEDEITVASAIATFGGSIFASDPRTFGVRAGYRF